MSRLPTPGGDSDNWGSILNDFLNQVHTDTGALRPGVVTEANLDTNTQAKLNIPDGYITNDKLSNSLQTTINNKADATSLAAVATSGDYGDLLNTPTIEQSGTIESMTIGESYSLGLAALGKVVESTSATSITVTIPSDAVEAFPVGSVVELYLYGTGAVTIVAGSGVTMHAPGGRVTLSEQYGSVAIRKRAMNEWTIIGDLE